MKLNSSRRNTDLGQAEKESRFAQSNIIGLESIPLLNVILVIFTVLNYKYSKVDLSHGT